MDLNLTDVAGNSNLCHASMNSAPLQITAHWAVCFSLSLICLTEFFVGDINVYNNVSFGMNVKAP